MDCTETVRIPLRGKSGEVRAHALVDAADAERVLQWTWSLSTSRGQHYVVGSVRADGQTRGTVVRLHRFVLGAPDGTHVTWINGDVLDNRRANLQVLTPAQRAQQRRGATRRSMTGVRGVTQLPSGRYHAEVWHQHRKVWSKRFTTLAEAEAAVTAARREHLPYA